MRDASSDDERRKQAGGMTDEHDLNVTLSQHLSTRMILLAVGTRWSGSKLCLAPLPSGRADEEEIKGLKCPWGYAEIGKMNLTLVSCARIELSTVPFAGGPSCSAKLQPLKYAGTTMQCGRAGGSTVWHGRYEPNQLSVEIDPSTGDGGVLGGAREWAEASSGTAVALESGQQRSGSGGEAGSAAAGTRGGRIRRWAEGRPPPTSSSAPRHPPPPPAAACLPPPWIWTVQRGFHPRIWTAAVVRRRDAASIPTWAPLADPKGGGGAAARRELHPRIWTAAVV
uniref:Uncharacterized protein n=1 Tax=Oryza punctata TaxID=4537 RepID=A0A0E0JZH0_ORYPU